MPDVVEPRGVPVRIDLHCHSRASTEADEAVLLALQCPESYSEPAQVYTQAKARGMDLVTITDHDSIAGVSELLPRKDVIVGEELTCYFPEDHCKIHLLVWGIGQAEHETLQNVAENIYRVAQYVAETRLAHAVAHPLYRQNSKLSRWHIERLLLMFKGFECLNGAHSSLHRDAFAKQLDSLDEQTLLEMERAHDMAALYEKPWIKGRTGGSDDHGLFNIGRTWTEFPAEARSVEEVLECLRQGRCHPGGEAGSSIKLAHNFYGVGIRYYTSQLAPESRSTGALLGKRLVGEKRGGCLGTARIAAGCLAGRLVNKTRKLLPIGHRRRRGSDLLGGLLNEALLSRIGQFPRIRSALRNRTAPLAEHESMFGLMSSLDRDVIRGIARTAGDAAKKGAIGEIFDAVAAVLAQQSLLLPYYFALFHQNQERQLLSKLTGFDGQTDRGDVRVGIFSDEIGGDGCATRMTQDAARFAIERNLNWTVHTCGMQPPTVVGAHRHFEPLVTKMIAAMGSELAVPPVLEVLEFADRKQFDAVVVNAPGPMGLCGLLVARMLRIPVIAAYHMDMEAAVFSCTRGDYRLSAGTRAILRWFYAQAARVVARSRTGVMAAGESGVKGDAITLCAPAAIQRPAPLCDRQEIWLQTRVREPNHLVCSVAIGSADDANLLAAVFQLVCQKRSNVALIFTADTAWAQGLMERLSGLPVYHVPARGARLASLYASAELLVHPHGNDVTAQAVVDALRLGLPAIVADVGAGSEFVEDRVTGRVMPAQQPLAWADAIVELLYDEAQRQRMGRNGRQRIARHTPGKDMETLWEECRRAVLPADSEAGGREVEGAVACHPNAIDIARVYHKEGAGA